MDNLTASGEDAVGKYGADVAAATLTITAQREEDVDFVKPFANLGLTALMLKSKDKPDWPFDFSIFKPLEVSVWCTVIILGIVVSDVLSSSPWRCLCGARSSSWALWQCLHIKRKALTHCKAFLLHTSYQCTDDFIVSPMPSCELLHVIPCTGVLMF